MGFTAKLLFQKLELGYDTWVLKNMFSNSEAETCTVENLKDQCIVCYAENVDIVALPCRHLCIGLNCANKIREDKKHRECPVCRNSKCSSPRNREVHQDERTVGTIHRRSCLI